MKQRKKFEKWAKYNGYPLERERDGETYCNRETHAAGSAWYAALHALMSKIEQGLTK